MMRVVVRLLVGLLMLSATTVSADPATSPDKLSVFVGIPPQKFLADKIGGDLIDVHVLLQPGQSPATYDPTPREIARLSDADVFFTIGMPFEAHLIEKAHKMIGDLHICQSQAGISRTMMKAGILDHREASHNHAGMPDPHIWLDPERVIAIVRTMTGELQRLDPAHKRYYAGNADSLIAQFTALDHRLGEELKSHEGEKILVFHPAYGYFCDRYGLEQIAIEIEGKEPGAKEMAEIIALARKENIQRIFVQPQFSTKTARAIADELGATIVPIDPLEENIFLTLLSMANTITEKTWTK